MYTTLGLALEEGAERASWVRFRRRRVLYTLMWGPGFSASPRGMYVLVLGAFRPSRPASILGGRFDWRGSYVLLYVLSLDFLLVRLVCSLVPEVQVRTSQFIVRCVVGGFEDRSKVVNVNVYAYAFLCSLVFGSDQGSADLPSGVRRRLTSSLFDRLLGRVLIHLVVLSSR
eukprot:scaffold96478_cov31-Tisochrysis_lutea.AAC.1